MICLICCEKFNKSTRLMVTCPNSRCNFKTCKKCIQQYLLNSLKVPDCMNCNIHWSQQFITENLNKSFIENEYKNYRTEILTQNEISKIPETIQFAESHIKLKKLEKEKKIVDEQIKELQKKSKLIYSEIITIKKGGIDKKNFTIPCQNSQCNGYISQEYKCELCELYTCPDCLEIIGNSKDISHICNPDSIKTAEEIKKTTKPCPNCGERIYKISGCDQMWCTQCKVGFDWKTSYILFKNIQNPHYNDHIRNINITVNREVNDIQCGGLDTPLMESVLFGLEELHRIYCIKCKHTNKFEVVKNIIFSIINKYYNFWVTISHVTYTDIPRIRRSINNLIDNVDLRVKYILKSIEKNEFSISIYKNDKNRRKLQEILGIYELFNICSIEIIQSIIYGEKIKSIDFANDEIQSFISYWYKLFTQISNLIRYCNKQFAIISASYNTTVPLIDSSTFKMIPSKKYNITDLKNNFANYSNLKQIDIIDDLSQL